MAEGTYEYECMRAELLGVAKPDYEDFLKKKQSAQIDGQIDDVDVDIENLKDANLGTEATSRISGGLDELNSILQVTQRKITKFKASCGSLTNLLRIKIGQSASSSSSSTNGGNEERSGEVVDGDAEATTSNGTSNCGFSSEDGRKSDLARALDNHVDRLDSLIDKAENAQFSMQHQSKEMKRFLH